MSARGRVAGPQPAKKSKNKGAQFIVLDMQKIKDQLGKRRCPCQKRKNPHSFCVFHCVVYMIPVCRSNVRCDECILVTGEQGVRLRASLSDQFIHLNKRLTAAMMRAYLNAMTVYGISLSWTVASFDNALVGVTPTGDNYVDYDKNRRYLPLPALTVEEAEERAHQAVEARLACEQGSPAKSSVSDAAIRHTIDLEISGDLDGDDGEQAAAEVSPRAAATVSGYKVGVHEIDDQDVYLDRRGVIQHVRVPAGFPKWGSWELVPKTSTWQLIDVDRQVLWLYQHPYFKTQPLAALDNDDPWDYRKPAVKSTGMKAPRTKSTATKSQAAGAVAVKSQAGRGSRNRKQPIPLRHEAADNSRQGPTDDEASGGQERMEIGGDMADEGNVAAAALTIEDFSANQPPLQQIQLQPQPQYVDLVDVDPDPSFAGPAHVLLARIQDEFMYLDMPVDGDPVWTSMSRYMNSS